MQTDKERWGDVEGDTWCQHFDGVTKSFPKREMATLESRRLRHKWRRKNVQNPKNDIKERHKKISEAAGCFQLDYFYQNMMNND